MRAIVPILSLIVTPHTPMVLLLAMMLLLLLLMFLLAAHLATVNHLHRLGCWLVSGVIPGP